MCLRYRKLYRITVWSGGGARESAAEIMGKPKIVGVRELGERAALRFVGALPGGFERRVPTCPECLAAIEQAVTDDVSE